MWSIISNLDELSQPATRAHRLSGRWTHHWECHIEPNWLLVWQYSDNSLVLMRTGTHADLFE